MKFAVRVPFVNLNYFGGCSHLAGKSQIILNKTCSLIMRVLLCAFDDELLNFDVFWVTHCGSLDGEGWGGLAAASSR